MAKNSKKVLLPFNQRLILNQYIVKEAFGFENLIDLSENLKTPKLETIDDEGHTGFLSIFLTRLALKNAIVTAPEVEEWDLNIVSHLKKINATRDTKLSLKYFQWLYSRHSLVLSRSTTFLKNQNILYDSFCKIAVLSDPNGCRHFETEVYTLSK